MPVALVSVLCAHGRAEGHGTGDCSIARGFTVQCMYIVQYIDIVQLVRVHEMCARRAVGAAVYVCTLQYMCMYVPAVPGALQKFFLRSAKGAASKYSCTGPQIGRCDIARHTRTRCQFCRYDKCKSIGMLLPGAPLPFFTTHYSHRSRVFSSQLVECCCTYEVYPYGPYGPYMP